MYVCISSFFIDCLKVLNQDEESKENAVHVVPTANVTTAVTSPQPSLAVGNVATPVTTAPSGNAQYHISAVHTNIKHCRMLPMHNYIKNSYVCSCVHTDSYICSYK